MKADPAPAISYSLTDPKEAKLDPCYDLYAKKIELSLTK